MDTDLWKTVEIGSYWVTLTPQLPLVVFSFSGLEFFGIFICEADILFEILLNELESFPAGLEEYVIKFRNRRSHVTRLEQIPRSYWYHINHRGEYFPIYREEGYNYGKGVVLDKFKLLLCILL